MRWILVFVLVAGQPLQTRAAGAQDDNFLPASWGVEDGLPQHVVGAVEQTRSGDLWCGTFNGLARFDGVKFTVYDEHSVPGLPARGVMRLYEDRQGTLWVGADSGAVTRVLNRVPVPTPEPLNRGSGSVLGFGEDAREDLWVLWQDGTVVRWRDGLMLKSTPDIGLREPELRLVQDGDGALWLVHQYGFSEVKESGLRPAAAGLAREGWGVQRAAASRKGGMWVVSDLKLRRWQQGAWVEDLGTCPWEETSGRSSRFVSVLRELQDGRLLAGLTDGGVALGRPGGAFRRFTRKDGLPHEWIRCATEDREGNVWLGTGGGGLAVLRQRRVQMVEVEPDAVRHNVQSLLPAKDGTLWVATEGGGIYHREAGGTGAFVRENNLPTQYCWSIAEDRGGRIWAGTWGAGLLVREGAGDFIAAPGWPEESPRVTVLHMARQGTVWAGGSGLLRRSTGGKWESKDASGGLLAPGEQRSIAEDAAGDLWIGLNNGRLLHRQGDRQEIFDGHHGLPGDAIVAVHPGGNGVIWIGSSGGGLLRFKDGKAVRFTTAQGLPHNVVSQILPGPGGFLWLGTYGGICRLAFTELEACAAGRLPRLNALVLRRSDGLATLECTSGGSPGACATADGRLWFPTNQGIAVVDPAKITLNPLPPPVYLESLTVDNQAIPLEGAAPVLGPGVSGVSLAYTALSFTAPDRVRFRTRLEGLENTWQDAGTERLATYRYLPPGQYTFHVTASNNDSVWNETGTHLTFTIRPHLWQTGWFVVLAGLATAGGVGSLVWAATRRRNAARLARVERIHALERERARIARDIHDDLGSGLTRIMLLTQSARSEMSADHPVAAELDNVCRAAEGLTRTMDEVVWAVDPRHDTMESLVGYVGSTAQELLQSARIRFRLEAPDDLPPWTLTADCRHSLFLACKEALNNIVRHSRAKTARVIFQVEPAAFTLTIEDDGTGFDPAAPSPARPGGGHGLSNMAARLTEAGGTCVLTSFHEKGTCIVFRLPHAVS